MSTSHDPTEPQPTPASGGERLSEPAPGTTIARRAADAAFQVPATREVWRPRPRSALDPTEIEAVARQLFTRVDPSAPSSYLRVLVDEVRHFYPQTVLQPDPDEVPIDHTLAESVTNGLPLFFQGACVGVGATTMLADYGTAYNLRASDAGDPSRVCQVQLIAECKTEKHLLDAVVTALDAPLTGTELRHRGPNALARRLLATLAHRRVTTLMIDPVSLIAPAVRGIVGGLIAVTNPSGRVPLEPRSVAAAQQRVAVILVDTAAPEILFREHPQVLGALEGRHVLLRPYRTVEQVGQALQLADIGLDDWGTQPDDERMAERILELTRGLPVNLHPFLALLHRIARYLKARPTPALVEAVLPHHRNMLELLSRAAEVPGGEEYATRAVRPRRGKSSWLPVYRSDALRAAEPSEDELDASIDDDDAAPVVARGPGSHRRVRAADGRGGRRAGTREERIADQRAARDRADDARRGLRGRRSLNLG